MALLTTIDEPADLRRLAPGQLPALAEEIRQFLIDGVCRTGGHLGPNLGVVELTIALHRVFDSPADRVLWDTGHQSYVHKLLTGRREGFDRLRQRGGLSGYPSRGESEHDVIENSHASTALSYADGLARAYALAGVTGRAVVPVVGDGALTGGMAWEALNNIGGAPDRPVIVVLNDNGRSYAPTVGGIAAHLDALRSGGAPGGGSVFEHMGLTYLGPVDGHDIPAVEEALRRARAVGRPVLVHCVTEKGRGYPPAEQHELDRFHVVRAKPTPQRSAASTGPSWTACFGAELTALAADHPEVVALTAAMLEPTGLLEFQRRYPGRVFDVGIAEQHAVTVAVGLAMGGLHPVLAIYATFANRAFDQILTDLALHGQAATFVLDRAGVTGDDGPSHNGVWDLSLLQIVPGLRIAAPRDGARLRECLREAVAHRTGPTVVRFPKGAVAPEVPAVRRLDGVDVLVEPAAGEVLVMTVGAMAQIGLDVASRLADQGIAATVVDPRWVTPVNPVLVDLAGRHQLVVTIEDNVRVGGAGSAVARTLADAGVLTPVRTFGIPHQFLAQGPRDTVLHECGLTAQKIAFETIDYVARMPRGGAKENNPALVAPGVKERTS